MINDGARMPLCCLPEEDVVEMKFPIGNTGQRGFAWAGSRNGKQLHWGCTFHSWQLSTTSNASAGGECEGKDARLHHQR